MPSSSFSSVSISHEPLAALKYNDLFFSLLFLSSSLLCFLLRMGTPGHTVFLLLTNFLFPFIFFSSIPHFLLLISLSLFFSQGDFISILIHFMTLSFCSASLSFDTLCCVSSIVFFISLLLSSMVPITLHTR